MFKISRIYFNKNKMNIFFNILLYSAILFTLFLVINNLYYEKKGQQSIFLSYPVHANYVSCMFGEERGFCNFDYDKIEEQIENEGLDDWIGYTKIDVTNEVDEEALVTVYINKYMSQFVYQLEQGEWLEDIDSVIVGGLLARQYKVGDYILVQRSDGIEYKVYVSGILPENYKLMLLNCCGDELDYNDIASGNLGNVMLTINQELVFENGEISEEALIIDDVYLDSLTQEMKSSLIITSFEAIGKELENTTNYYNMALLVLTILSCILYGIYLESKKTQDELQVLYQSGLNFGEISLIILVPQIFFCGGALFLVAFFHIMRMKVGEGNMIYSSILTMTGIMFIIFYIAYMMIYQYLRYSWIKIEKDLV